MELSQDVKAGLVALSKPQTFNAAQFAAVIKLTLDAVVSMQEVGKSLEGTAVLAAIDKRLLKEVHRAVATVYLEAAKQNYEEELFQALLTEQGLGPKQSEMMKDAYVARREDLRGLLGRSSFHFPHIVDVDWRLDYHMKSSKVEKIDEPIWYITLKTVTDEGEHRDVQFTCNREEMQQFLAKVKDADSASRMFE